MKWLKDEEFLRGNIPMTKFDIRLLTLGILDISEGDKFLDIGAGTGSISIQAAKLGAQVYSLERDKEGVELIKKNSVKFEVTAAVIVLPGEARDLIKESVGVGVGVNKCFIGGSGGDLRGIVTEVSKIMISGGIIAGNFIIPDNMVEFKNLLGEYGYIDIEVKLIQSSIMDKLGLMKGQNPVFIVGGRKR